MLRPTVYWLWSIWPSTFPLYSFEKQYFKQFRQRSKKRLYVYTSCYVFAEVPNFNVDSILRSFFRCFNQAAPIRLWFTVTVFTNRRVKVWNLKIQNSKGHVTSRDFVFMIFWVIFQFLSYDEVLISKFKFLRFYKNKVWNGRMPIFTSHKLQRKLSIWKIWFWPSYRDPVTGSNVLSTGSKEPWTLVGMFKILQVVFIVKTAASLR